MTQYKLSREKPASLCWILYDQNEFCCVDKYTVFSAKLEKGLLSQPIILLIWGSCSLGIQYEIIICQKDMRDADRNAPRSPPVSLGLQRSC